MPAQFRPTSVAVHAIAVKPVDRTIGHAMWAKKNTECSAHHHYGNTAVITPTTTRTATQASVKAPAPRRGIIHRTLCPGRIGSLPSLYQSSWKKSHPGASEAGWPFRGTAGRDTGSVHPLERL